MRKVLALLFALLFAGQAQAQAWIPRTMGIAVLHPPLPIPPPPVYVLDLLSATPSMAYSVRRLRAAYLGASFQAKRDIDNATQDIGFVPNTVDLDTASLNSFCNAAGATSAYVTKFYDQSGNGRDLTSVDVAHAPRVCSSGTNDTKNSITTMYYDPSSTTRKLTSATFNTLGAGATFEVVAGVKTDTSNRMFISKTGAVNTNVAAPLDPFSSAMNVGNGTASASDSLTPKGIQQANGFAVWSFAASPTAGGTAERRGFYNGSVNVAATTAPANYSDGGSTLNLGARADNNTTLNGWISEAIVFPAVTTSGDNTLLWCNQGTYFTITVSGC